MVSRLPFRGTAANLPWKIWRERPINARLEERRAGIIAERRQNKGGLPTVQKKDIKSKKQNSLL